MTDEETKECPVCGREDGKRDELGRCLKEGRTLGQAVAHARGAKEAPHPGRFFA